MTFDDIVTKLVLICRAFHHYRGEEKEALEKHPELGKLLREEYRTLDDFRAKNTTTT